MIDLVTPDAPPAAPATAAGPARAPLGGLVFGRRVTGEAASARFRLMQRLRIGLPVLALLLTLVFFSFARRSGDGDIFLEDFAEPAILPEELRMEAPRFAGVDSRGHPYDITAAAALQNADDLNRVRLEAPEAEAGAADARAFLTARTGDYDTEANRLVLNDDVTFRRETEDGTYVLTSRTAVFEVEDETVTTDAGVTGVGPDGARLKADRMTAHYGEGRVVLEGNVKMRLPQRRAAAAADGPDAAATTEAEGPR